MDKAQISKALEELKKEKKRNFLQSYDLIINLRDIDVKTKPVDAFLVMPNSRGKKVKICAIVGQELAESAAKACDKVIREKDLQDYKDDKKKAKKLAAEYDFFIAQSNMMAQIAAAFGRIFGPRGKMPNPKAGCVVTPATDLKVLVERLQKTVQTKAKTMPTIQCRVGSEQMSDEQVSDNILSVYSQLTKLLPNEEQNIGKVSIKKSMSKLIKIK